MLNALPLVGSLQVWVSAVRFESTFDTNGTTSLIGTRTAGGGAEAYRNH